VDAAQPWPVLADVNGVPWSAKYIACLGDPIADLTEDMAAEQKARATYERLIAATGDPLAKDTLRFLWEREVAALRRDTQRRPGVDDQEQAYVEGS
jgi:Mn-containing catalase